MLFKLREQYKKLVSSADFKEHGYFCSAFIMADFSELEKQDWQLDFYNEKKDTIASYMAEPEIKKINEDSEVYKESKEKRLERLELDEKFLDFKKILETAEKELKKLKEIPNKTIVVLQKEGSVLWNLSFVTNNFNLINIKIDAVSGEILENKKVELLNWKG